jgi:uncharacterized protein YndB with AHSA1/START domain
MSSTYTVERSRTIDAPADRVYQLVANFEQWTRWSPWEDADPAMERRYSGAESGVGAVYSWAGNRKAGSGRMEITRADDPRLVEIALQFEKPFKSSNLTVFTIDPIGGADAVDSGQSRVTWRMTGPRPLLLKLLSPVMNMEKLVGKDFDRGLDRLAEVARPKPAG